MTESPGPVRIVAVDDHPIVLEGIIALLNRSDRTFDLVASTRGWPEMAEKLDAGLVADLALVDLHRGDGTSPEAAVAGAVERDLPVVVVTSELRPVPIRRAIEAGALGLVLKSDPVDQVLDAIDGALHGEMRCSSDLAFVLMSDPALHPRLAPREIEALSLLADGWPRKIVGTRMDPPVSQSTVVTYINRVVDRYRHLGRDIGTTADAVREATRDGYLDHPEPDLV